jgi:putative zinc finger protein
MSCDEHRIEAFLAGGLSDADEQAFDEHLLVCEPCWWAVQEDRAGRLAVDRLRVTAPPGLADRLTAAVDLAGKELGDETGHSRRRTGERGRRRAGGRGRRAGGRGTDRVRSRTVRRFVAGTALAAVVVAGTLGWVLDEHPAGDPPQIADVAAMASARVANDPALRGGEHFDLGGQSVTVRAYRVGGITTVVATSATPFPMPASSHLVTGSSSTAWMATDGRLAMYGVNRLAGGRESMFLVAAMPMARLPQVAAQLHLI